MSRTGYLSWTLVTWPLLLLISVALVAFAPYPFVFVLALLIVALGIAAFYSPTSGQRAFYVNCAVVLACLLLLEVYWVNKSSADSAAKATEVNSAELTTADDNNPLIIRTPYLGYSNAPNYRGEARKVVGDSKSFAVTYTTDAYGNRSGWSPVQTDDDQCIVLLGCSFTFGLGLNDDETMAYSLGALTNKHVVNLGVSGYGPHQILAALEFDVFPDYAECTPSVFIYQAIPDHIRRVAGLAEYDRHGPRYRFTDRGNLEFTGQFSDFADGRDSKADNIWTYLFGKSFAYQEYALNREWIGDSEIDLYLTVVRQLKKRLQQRFPGSKFVIIYWDDSNKSYAKKLKQELPLVADTYIGVTEILPHIRETREIYYLPNDPHPNALANKTIAEYIATVIRSSQSLSDMH